MTHTICAIFKISHKETMLSEVFFNESLYFSSIYEKLHPLVTFDEFSSNRSDRTGRNWSGLGFI